MLVLFWGGRNVSSFSAGCNHVTSRPIIGTTTLSTEFFFVWYIECVMFSSLQFIGASMGTTDLSIPADSGESSAPIDLPERACCVVIEYLYLGTLRQHLYAHRKRKIGYKIVVEFALDLANG